MRRFSVLKFFLPPFYFSLVETLKKRSVQNKHPPLHLPPGEKKNVPNQDPPRRPHRGLHARRRLPLRVLERPARDRRKGAPGGLPLSEELPARGRQRPGGGGDGRKSGGFVFGFGDDDDDDDGGDSGSLERGEQQPLRQSEAEPRDRAREPCRRRDESEGRQGRRGGGGSSSCCSGDGGRSLRRRGSFGGGVGGGGGRRIALCGSDGGRRCRL